MCNIAMSVKDKLIKTNDPNIVVYENLLQPDDCNEIADYVIQDKINNTQEEGMPWEKGNNILLDHVDKKFYDYIIAYRWMLNSITSMYFKEIVYPTHSDIVLWNKGDSMIPHVDDGSRGTADDVEGLWFRDYSAVTYLNDDFTGGETFVKDYVNTPKTGSVIIFPSSYEHGVHEVLEGKRVTFAMWFTLNPNKIEKTF